MPENKYDRDDERARSNEPTPPEARGQGRSNSTPTRVKWVFIGFLAISAFFLLAEHRAHLFGFLPWLILLACPLMHIFMHRGHGHGGHSHGANSNGRKGDDR